VSQSKIKFAQIGPECVIVYDEKKNYCEIPLEKETSILLSAEVSSFTKAKYNIYDLFRFVKDKTNISIKHILIESKSNEEFKSYIEFEEFGKFYIKVSDILSLFDIKTNDVFIDDSLLTIINKDDDLEKQLSDAISKEDFKEAERIQGLIDGRS